MQMTKFAAVFVAVLVTGTLPAFAGTTSICDGVAGNLVSNCGFEGGVTSSTIGGNTNTSVPVSWTPSAGYDLEPPFNHTSTIANSGNVGLSIGNDNGQLVPTLSQTLTDVLGATYSGSLYVDYGGTGTGDTTPFFNVQINSANVLSLDHTAPGGAFFQYTFSFTGTGSDVLTFGGNTNPSEWYVDDIVVTGALPSVPEPGSLLLLATASGPLLALRRRLSR
jgi:hypothetical protein